MTFQQGGRFEGGRVQRRRGGGRGVAIGGGIGVGGLLLVLLVTMLGGGDGTELLDTLGGGEQTGEEQGTVGDCDADQANTDRSCRLSATIQSLDVYWTEQLGSDFPLPEVVEFAGATSTGCGAASSSTGPFYCPADQTIYIDLTFYDLLQSSYGASGGPLAEMYVTAHEYGHHVQQVTGVFDAADRAGAGPTSDQVRVELQADCYAGVWAGTAATVVDPDTGVTFLEPITSDELADALSAAQAVGDDHIQQQSGGGVQPDTWTHGSSEQRQRWFTTGYTERAPGACDTFAAAEL